MKTTKQLLVATTAAACLAASASLTAQDAQGRVRVGDTELKGAVQTETSDSTHLIGKANKASSLIGMDVRNTQNEKLGEIKDLVVDLHSGKIGYAVLSVGGFLGIGDKYVAVPPSAFHLAPDQDTVVLNADKAKLQNAPGFARNNWPDLNSVSTHSAYWLSDSTAQGVSGSTRLGTGAGQSTLDRDLNSTRSEVNRSTSSGLDRTANRTDRGQIQATGDRSTFSGRITAIQPESRTVTVEGASGTRQFTLDERASLALKDSRSPSLSDFKVGFPVTVGYHQENGKFVAHSLIRSDAPEVR